MLARTLSPEAVKTNPIEKRNKRWAITVELLIVGKLSDDWLQDDLRSNRIPPLLVRTVETCAAPSFCQKTRLFASASGAVFHDLITAKKRPTALLRLFLLYIFNYPKALKNAPLFLLFSIRMMLTQRIFKKRNSLHKRSK